MHVWQILEVDGKKLLEVPLVQSHEVRFGEDVASRSGALASADHRSVGVQQSEAREYIVRPESHLQARGLVLRWDFGEAEDELLVELVLVDPEAHPVAV